MSGGGLVLRRSVKPVGIILATVALLGACASDDGKDLVAAFQIADMQDNYSGERLLRLCQAYESMLEVNSEPVVLAAAVDIVNEQRVEPLRPQAVEWLHDLLRSCVG